MSHLIILPLLLPLFSGALLLMATNLSLGARRALSLVSTWALVPLSLLLLRQADQGSLQLYALGSWPPPFGIVLVLDRLAALMLVVTAVLASFALLYGCRGDDRRGANFHALYQFQLLGVNGAFLTGDLFNLFVFFEILLIASYTLLVHGAGPARIRAGLHYVVLNLVGSTLFLFAVGTLYATVGTLNMADLAARMGQVPAAQQPLVSAAGYLLLLVFGLKAAALPLYGWLPQAYAAASAPVAALFAIMTKVGLYAILRVFTLIYGSAAGDLADLAQPLLLPLAALTLAAGVLGALAADTLHRLLAYLLIVSVGTLLAGIALGNASGIAAALFYLIHSSWIAGALFLVADLVARQRGELRTRLSVGPPLRQPLLLAGMFFVGAVAVAGLPPFSGFLGKVMLLQSTENDHQALLVWPVVLAGGFGMLVALSRAGSRLFWQGDTRVASDSSGRADPWRVLAAAGLLLGSPLLVVAAQPVHGYALDTARQLLDLKPYLDLVAGARP